MEGYKVFNPDWTCRGFQYEVGEVYEEDVNIQLCRRGFHFCVKPVDCFSFYSFNPDNKVALVEALGEVLSDDKKTVTNKIKIVREIPWSELLTLVNTGIGNTGYSNSGDRNSGDRNSGHSNSGYSNSGDRNSGYSNSGYSNSGDRNSGDRNSGHSNSGDRNSGHSNSGDYNTGDFNLSDSNTGCFCSEEKTIEFFDKASTMTLFQWRRSDAFTLLSRIQFKPTTWIYLEDMTDEEKQNTSDYETLQGYLRVNDLSEVNQKWWDGLSLTDKSTIEGIPNFDEDKFCKIMGIKI